MSDAPISPADVLRSVLRTPLHASAVLPRLLVAGATGVLGNEVVRRLVGSGRFSHTDVLSCAVMATGMPAVGIVQVDPAAAGRWPALARPAHTGIVMFEAPRLYHGRERSLYTPQPDDLPAVARWMKQSGVQTLVVVVPHATGRLPDALKHGLANLDEQAVSALGFDRLLLVRSAHKRDAEVAAGILNKTAAWMLSTLSYMIPASAQPVRPAKLAEFIEAALGVLPVGTHVASPELLWQANQSAGGMHQVVGRWLESAHNPGLPATRAKKPID